MSSPSRLLAGHIVYRRDGRQYGHERWQLTSASAGRTLTASCRLDDEGLQRDVAVTVGPDERLREAYIHLVADGRWAGSGLYRGVGAGIEAQLWGPGRDIQHQRVDVEGPWFLVTHPVSADGWAYGIGDEGSDGVRRYTCINTSSRPDGGDGPLLRTHPLGQRTVTVDTEVTVGAGTFRAVHFQVLVNAPGMPPFDVWYDPVDRVLLRLEWPGYGDYELVALSGR